MNFKTLAFKKKTTEGVNADSKERCLISDLFPQDVEDLSFKQWCFCSRCLTLHRL